MQKEMPVIQIRDVQSSDVPKVVALVTEVLAEFGLRFGVGSTTDVEVTTLPDSYLKRGGGFWVATESSGRIVGTCGVFPVDHETYELRKMYIYSASRGFGIAQLFMDACVSFVRERNGRQLVLDTIHEMDRAIAFYEKNGFVRDDAWIRGARCTRGYIKTL